MSLSASERGCFTIGDAGDPEHLRQLLRRHFQRARARAHAGGGLRIGGRARGVKGDVAFDLLNDLMDVSIQHRDRTEAAQAGSMS